MVYQFIKRQNVKLLTSVIAASLNCADSHTIVIQIKMTEHEADQALSPGTEDEGQRDFAAKTSKKRFRANRKVVLAVAGVLAGVGLILFIVGLVLIVKSKNEGRQHSVSSEQDNDKDKLVDKCSFSPEAKRAGQCFIVCRVYKIDKFILVWLNFVYSKRGIL